MDIVELKEKLSEIKQMEYIETLRRGDTGIGLTLETLLEVKENNLRTPDLGNIEIKSHRKRVSTPITMFTFNRGAWKIKQKEVIEQYGYIDYEKDRPALYCTLGSKPNNQDLYMKVEEETIRLYHVSDTLVAEWPGEALINAFREKFPALVMVLADTRINSNKREEFWFNEAYFLTDPDQDNLLELIKREIVIIDVRMHLPKNRPVRNHGTGFRMSARFLDQCFGSRERII